MESNLRLTLRERGKLVRGGRRVTHNIFLTLGREWLPDLVSYTSLPAGSPPPSLPVTKADNRGIRYMGLGIGGTTQDSASVSSPPFSTHYPGTNAQDDQTPSVQRLERPVRITSANPASPVLPPYDADDVWLGQVQAPPVKPTTTSVRFTRVFSENEISYGPFLTVPLTEIALILHSDASSFIHVYNNVAVAYDVFEVLKKTTAVSLQVDWELRF